MRQSGIGLVAEAAEEVADCEVELPVAVLVEAGVHLFWSGAVERGQ